MGTVVLSRTYIGVCVGLGVGCSNSGSPSLVGVGNDAGRDSSAVLDVTVMDAGIVDANQAATNSDGGRNKRVFVTHGKWDGNLQRAANMAGRPAATGRAGADALCNVSASTAGLDGSWMAWVSDSTTNAIDRIQDVGPWYGLDGSKVFESKAGLVGNPLTAIVVDEIGGHTDYAMWTGTLADGKKAAATCSDWTSSSAQDYGMCGSNNATTQEKWSEFTIPLCNNPYNLYCFEQ